MDETGIDGGKNPSAEQGVPVHLRLQLLCVQIETELSVYPGGSPGPPRMATNRVASVNAMLSWLQAVFWHGQKPWLNGKST